MSIKDMAYYERPREKAALYGLENLTNCELLAILISTGTKNCSSLDIANNLLITFKGINGIIRATTTELTKVKGINYAKALRIHSGLFLYERALLEDRILKINDSNKDSIGKYFIAKIGNLNQEVGYVVIVNSKNKVLKIVELFKGSIDSLNASQQLLLKEVIGVGNRFYFIHNHPSGKVEPSINDLKFTANLDLFSMTLGIELIDHLIITNEEYLSIREFQARSK